MNTHFHAPSFGDETFELDDDSTSTPTTSFIAGNHIANSSYMHQQPAPSSTKRAVSFLNTSDEYLTANEESFNVATNNSMKSSIAQEQNTNNVMAGGLAGNATPSSTLTTGHTTMAARKQMLPVDQNEPAKPLSAYALFFRDTVSAIKQQNPSCSFQELSKIVSSMWDALDPVHKGVYNKKNEMAKIEYFKQMKLYQQQQQLKQDQLNSINSQQQQHSISPQVAVNNTNQQTNALNNNNSTTDGANPVSALTPAAPSEDQIRLLTEAGSAQKCTRENCNKRAIINPDWEDEYCSNECVIIHCRNVFNEWVQFNIDAKQQQQTTQTST